MLKNKTLLFITVILFSVMVSIVFCVTVSAESSGICGDNITWIFDEETGNLTISGTGDMYDFSYPDYSPWYLYRENIICLNISNGITSIGNNALRDCDNLISIEIPNSVKYIKEATFANCDNLVEVNLGNSIISIGEDAFYGCIGLSEIELPDTIADIGNSAFNSCDSLIEINLPKNLTSINKGLFGYCDNLETVNIPEGVTDICGSAFIYCKNLKEIAIPKSVTHIKHWAFYGCNIKSVYIEDIVAWCNIDFEDSLSYPLDTNGALYLNNFPIKKLIIPEDVNELGDYAFKNCATITSVILPDTLTSIGVEAFSGCSLLEEINIPKSVNSIKNETFYACESLVSITIPNNVISINEYAFYECNSLSDVKLPENLTIMSKGIFKGCDELTQLNIPNSVTTIEDEAFSGCRLLSEINIPKSVKTIGNETFNHCISLENLTLFENITLISHSAFNNCEKLILTVVRDSYAHSYADNIGLMYYLYCEHINTHIDNAVKPTCIDKGYSGDKYCDDCGRYIEYGTEISATGHSYSEWYVSSKATCDEDGSKYRYCYYCFDKIIEVLPLKGHNYTCVTTQPSCISEGYTTYTCKTCNDSYIMKFSGIIGHDYSEWIITKEATCKEEGEKYKVCSVCSEKIIEIIPYDRIKVYTEKATCFKDGYNVYYCKKCDEYINEWIYSTGKHNYFSEIVLPTCVDEGYIIEKCEFCGDSYKHDFVQPVGHILYHITEISPTCTKEGYILYQCKTCKEYQAHWVSVLEHDYVVFSESEATYCDPKTVTYICVNCSVNYTQEEGYALCDFDKNGRITEEDYGKFEECTEDIDIELYDFDGDGKIEKFDKTVLELLISGKNFSEMIDVNEDGQSDIRDLVRIKKNIADSSDNDNQSSKDAEDVAFARKFVLVMDERLYKTDN